MWIFFILFNDCCMSLQSELLYGSNQRTGGCSTISCCCDIIHYNLTYTFQRIKDWFKLLLKIKSRFGFQVRHIQTRKSQRRGSIFTESPSPLLMSLNIKIFIYLNVISTWFLIPVSVRQILQAVLSTNPDVCVTRSHVIMLGDTEVSFVEKTKKN